MRKLRVFLTLAVTGLFLLSSCSSYSGYCKSKKKMYKSQKCWNAKKQKMVRC